MNCSNTNIRIHHNSNIATQNINNNIKTSIITIKSNTTHRNISVQQGLTTRWSIYPRLNWFKGTNNPTEHITIYSYFFQSLGVLQGTSFRNGIIIIILTGVHQTTHQFSKHIITSQIHKLTYMLTNIHTHANKFKQLPPCI